MRRDRVLVAIAVVLAVAWRPVVEPAGQATILIADLFARSLVGVDAGAFVAPPVREAETRETFAGIPMRVSWWRPGFGSSHAALMIVNGATEAGNDNAATRGLGRALARAGFLAMLPELPFLKEGRFDPEAAAQLDAAFEKLRGLPETEGRAVGAFGSSVGAGVLLAAAGREPALGHASEIVVLGAYFDLDTYLASVATGTQRSGGALVPWTPSEEARRRLPPAALAAMTSDDDRARLEGALREPGYDAVLRALRALPPTARERLDALSPRADWAHVAPPIYWIHDPDDAFEPPAEGDAAAAAPRAGALTLMVPRLVQHAEVSPTARAQGPLFVIGELLRLVGFAFDVLRRAG